MSNQPRKVGMDSRKQGMIRFEVDGVPQDANYTWFRGEHCNFNPKLENMLEADSVAKHVLKGWIPDEPVITKDTRVVAFGSCFAANITNWLARRNFNVLTDKDGDWGDTYIVRFGEGMVNSFVIRQQFEWALEKKVFEEELWHGYSAEAFGYDENVRQQTEQVFMSSDFFVITLGLSEVWYDKQTGGVFWRAVPRDKYDPDRHSFRVTTVEENRTNIQAIYDLIRKYRPEAKVLFTLSPVPLVATFRPESCITANSVSKAILRAALDEFLRANMLKDRDLHYWPSYEIVMDVFADRWKSDRRHVKEEILDFIMTLFEHTWCSDSEPEMTLNEAWIRACSAASILPKALPGVLERNDRKRISAILEKMDSNGNGRMAQIVRERIREIVDADPASSLGALV